MPKPRKIRNIDAQLTARLSACDEVVRCPDGHLNTKTAIICWKCGKLMKRKVLADGKT